VLAGTRRVTSHDELLTATGGDPFVRYEIPDDLPEPAFVNGSSALMVRRAHSGRSGMAAVGDADGIGRILAYLTGEPALAGVSAITVPRTSLDALAPQLPLTGEGGDWDWMWIDVPANRLPTDERIVNLDDSADAAELTALNVRGNPSAESEPGSGRTELWLGARDDSGAIVAAGALHRNAAGAGHLTGIVVDPDHRGTGLGAAVTVALTRAAIEGPGRISGICTLGMYATNDVARRLYQRLGYRTAQAFASRRIGPLGPTPG